MTPEKRKPAASKRRPKAAASRKRAPAKRKAKAAPKRKASASEPARTAAAVPAPEEGGLSQRTQRGLAAAVIALLAALVFLAFAVTGDDDDEGDQAGPVAPVELTASELANRVSDFDHPVYWTGDAPPDRYELSSTNEDRVFIRYLTPRAQVGDERPIFPTVGTYPVADAIADLEAAAAQGETGLEQREGYSLLVEDETRVYVVFDDQPELEIEVFDPRPGRALDAIDSGTLEPID